mmetsp:Transcript_27485/g.69970  ORF Transcript_27485/g.69970 Transcript_27485/m.69970 type:complete len:283 (+) Transcript_27485:145-993(+)
MKTKTRHDTSPLTSPLRSPPDWSTLGVTYLRLTGGGNRDSTDLNWSASDSPALARTCSRGSDPARWWHSHWSTAVALRLLCSEFRTGIKEPPLLQANRALAFPRRARTSALTTSGMPHCHSSTMAFPRGDLLCGVHFSVCRPPLCKLVIAHCAATIHVHLLEYLNKLYLRKWFGVVPIHNLDKLIKSDRAIAILVKSGKIVVQLFFREGAHLFQCWRLLCLLVFISVLGIWHGQLPFLFLLCENLLSVKGIQDVLTCECRTIHDGLEDEHLHLFCREPGYED